MKMPYCHKFGHYEIHVHDKKCIYNGQFIGVSRDEFKLKLIKKSVTNFLLIPG